MSDRDSRFSQEDSYTPSVQQTDQGVIIESPAIVVPLATKEIEGKKTPQKNHLHLLSAFCEKPDHVTFEMQEPNEQILLFLRKSKIHNIPWILFSLLLASVPFFVYLVKGYIFPFDLPLPYMILGLIFYYLLLATYAFVNFITWYFNAAIITDKRIIDIDFHQLVMKDVAETKLSLVQDVDLKQTGVIPNLFDFGSVLVQTAGTIDNFEFNGMPKPEKIVDIVNELIGKGRIYVP